MNCDLDEDSGIDGRINGVRIPCGYKVFGKTTNIKRKFPGKTKEIKTSDACAAFFVSSAKSTDVYQQISGNSLSAADLLFGPEPKAATPVSCVRSILKLPKVIIHTLALLLQSSCTQASIDKSWVKSYPPLAGKKYPGHKTKRKRREGKSDVSGTKYSEAHINATSRLAPISVSASGSFKTKFDYTNTRHRYPWICSLRSKGRRSEHLCAVTVLSVKPWIIVGAAHCTFLCKDRDPIASNKGSRLDACCCNSEASGCSDDKLRCGRKPGASEMDPFEVVIIILVFPLFFWCKSI